MLIKVLTSGSWAFLIVVEVPPFRVLITDAQIGKVGVNSDNTPKNFPTSSDIPPDVCYEESFAGVYNVLALA